MLGSDLRGRDRDIEIGFHREHQLDHIDRAEAGGGQRVIDRHRPNDGVFDEEPFDQGEQSVPRQAGRPSNIER